MRAVLFALLVAVPLLAGGQQASYLDFPAAINKAGRQRMLAESMVKEYLQVMENISAAGARGRLAEAIWVFDDQMADLKAFASTPGLKQAAGELGDAWLVLRRIATGPVNREQAAAIRIAAGHVLQAAERNTAVLERAAGGSGGRLVNLSGRQRMLSRQIAKDFLLLAARIDEGPAREELRAATSDFAAAMKELRAAPESTAEILAELAAAQEKWDALEKILARERYDRAGALQVIEATDAIVSRMERATFLYQKLGASPG